MLRNKCCQPPDEVPDSFSQGEIKNLIFFSILPRQKNKNDLSSEDRNYIAIDGNG
jgi:hypothetical protein